MLANFVRIFQHQLSFARYSIPSRLEGFALSLRPELDVVHWESVDPREFGSRALKMFLNSGYRVCLSLVTHQEAELHGRIGLSATMALPACALSQAVNRDVSRSGFSAS